MFHDASASGQRRFPRRTGLCITRFELALRVIDFDIGTDALLIPTRRTAVGEGSFCCRIGRSSIGAIRQYGSVRTIIGTES
ncbi:MAG: hypothetical protein C3L25_02415 [Candidatus Sedimenticola endophacoides]|nr:MAG: hypothetical protein C3L26_02425 [Candidatus Sedimenticola endophacoides]PUE04964.1 MAG: hypothetical protein C3L25_02415 [Candidatus Sedimenticola endophacoides]